MKKILSLLIFPVFFILSHPAQAEFVRGEINDWGTNDFLTLDTDFGFPDNMWAATIISTNNRASSNFKFDRHGDWTEQWGSGPNVVLATVNASIGEAQIDNEDGNGSNPPSLTFAESDGKYYSFRLRGNYDWWDRSYVVMETSEDPANVVAVGDDFSPGSASNVTVTIELSKAKSFEETIYVRYALNDSNFGTSSLVAASGTGRVYTATIPGQPTTTTVSYYVLTSTMPISDIQSNYDLCTLRGSNNDRLNYHYGAGLPKLTINGQNGEYSTTKTFLDERANETFAIDVILDLSGIANLDIASVEIFSNLNRRDYVDNDWDSNGIADGIKFPDFNNITQANAEGGAPSYYRPYSMTHDGAQIFSWSTNITECGAYRLSARYKTTTSTNWQWYLQNDSTGTEVFSEAQQLARSHAIVASPVKALEMTLYEINPLTVEATNNTYAGRSTFNDLLGAPVDTDGFDPFNLDHLNVIQANCLWFQPIHPNGDDSRTLAEGYLPGSPYATKNYFAVSGNLSEDGTSAGALAEFTNFVFACDAYTGSVGSVNIMLDFVANHTSWDAVFGQGGADLFGRGVNEHIWANWYSKSGDYCQPATFYNDEYDNDIANAPDRGDFGKWDDVAELYYGRYSALVCLNPTDNGSYLNEGDWVDFLGMDTETQVPDIWQYIGYYPEYWIKESGHPGNNADPAADHLGVDAFRCDFGQGLPPQLWEYIINRTRTVKWNTVFMAETLDGGKPGYRSNRHFDILNENMVFQFTQAHVNNSWEIRQALEDRRTVYNGGAILLNMTGHDETLPDSDAWLNATRYAALSSVDGLPMIYMGMERAMQNYNTNDCCRYYDGFLTEHELNFGKSIPHFKKWNKLMVWEYPPPNFTGMDTWYGQVNWARLNSPALQSQNRWFLSTTGGGEVSNLFAVAKYQETNVGPRNTDIVLAFTLLFPHGSAHGTAADTYDLRGDGDALWNTLGLDVGKNYTAKNIASSDASAVLSGWPRSGQDLYDNGIFVALYGDDSQAITTDGAIVQYLRLEESLPEVAIENITGFGPHNIHVPTETGLRYTIEYSDDFHTLTTGATWAIFANPTNGIFDELAGPSTNIFIDDFGADTTSGMPADDTRVYRIKLEFQP